MSIESRSTLVWESRPGRSLLGARRHRRVAMVAWLMTGLALAGLGWGGWTARQQTQAIEAGEARNQAVQAGRSASPAAATARPVPSARRDDGGLVPGQALSASLRQSMRAVARQLNIPWQELFEQLERSTPSDVALVSVEPDGQRGLVRLQAEAKSLDTLLGYAASLQGQGVLGRLSYHKHETNDQDPNKPRRLTFELGLEPSRQAEMPETPREQAR